MRFIVKRKTSGGFSQTGIHSYAHGSEVKAGIDRLSTRGSEIKPVAVEGKRARKLRLMRENGERFVTFYIETKL